MIIFQYNNYIIIFNLYFIKLNFELNIIYSKLLILDKQLLIYYYINILLDKS